MAKTDSKKEFRDPTAGPIFSTRFVIALLLIVLGIAWIVYYYVVVRVDPTIVPAPEPGGPKVFETLTDWKGVNWNYVGGFTMVLLGLAIAAHPSTPLGRGRGVVVGMLGCFLDRPGLDLHLLRRQRRPLGDPGHQRPRAVQPRRRHRADGRRLHLRHALGVSRRFWLRFKQTRCRQARLRAAGRGHLAEPAQDRPSPAALLR